MTPDRRSNWRSNLALTCPRPLQREQRRIHGLALGPTRRSARQLHTAEGDHEPECPDRYGRDVSQPASVWRLP